jgi:hypothetical protein
VLWLVLTTFFLKQPYTEDGAAAEKRKYRTRKTH